MTPILQFFFTVGNNLIAAIRSLSASIYANGGYGVNPVDVYHLIIFSVFFIIPVLTMIVSFHKERRDYSFKKEYSKRLGRNKKK